MEERIPKHFVSVPFTYHQIIELSIDNVTNLGLGVGRIDEWVVMVPFVISGECVRARIYRNHKNYSEADLVEVLEASPHRREACCPLYGICGGCQYQHIDYVEQRKVKQAHVCEYFHRSGWTDSVVPLPLMGKEWGYRTKITPHFQAPKSPDFPIGFLRRGSHSALVDVPRCLIATDAIQGALAAARSDIRQRWSSFHRGQTLLFRDVDGNICQEPQRIVEQKVGEYSFAFRAGDFFQNNAEILPKMVHYVVRQASGDPVNFLIDTYCGVGLFAISSARYFEKVVGIEVNEDAILLARKNAKSNGMANVKFFRGASESIFEQIAFPADQSAVVIDPPRKGCELVFLQQLIHFYPRRIVYISCDPSTQVRDLKELLSRGYHLCGIQPIDLFPQTRHVENIAVLSLS
jgi:23S rRNA (uracil1939-C5)-methyltransferase/tRNA (uracil-5-)-methyltransferase